MSAALVLLLLAVCFWSWARHLLSRGSDAFYFAAMVAALCILIAALLSAANIIVAMAGGFR